MVVPRASAHQSDEVRLYIFRKIPFQAKVMRNRTWIEEIWPFENGLKV